MDADRMPFGQAFWIAAALPGLAMTTEYGGC